MTPTLANANGEVKQTLIYQKLKARCNAAMDIHAHRRLRLRELIDTAFEGSRKSFCDQADISESRLAQLLSETYRKGGEFGEKVARKIEGKLRLPKHYFDLGMPGLEPAGQNGPQLVRAPVHEETDIATLDEVIELLAAYKDCSKEIRRSIRLSAKVGAERTLRARQTISKDKA